MIPSEALRFAPEELQMLQARHRLWMIAAEAHPHIEWQLIPKDWEFGIIYYRHVDSEALIKFPINSHWRPLLGEWIRSLGLVP